jgi:type IV fimbrial biogenesis protein FimT
MKQSGATLLELLVVLAVTSVLLTLGIPRFASLVHANRLTSATNALISSLHLARSEAIKRNARTAMCPSITGTSCAASGGWHQGWVVFHDANNNAMLDGAEFVMLRQPALPEGFRLTGNTPVSRYISYTPAGSARKISGAIQAGTLTVCRRSSEQCEARQVVISSTGRPRTTRTVLAFCS